MSYSSRDNQLLTEAFELQLLKESYQDMSISQTLNNLDLMSESQLEYVCQVNERILNEFFGGIKNIFGGGKQAASGSAKALGGAGSRLGQGIKNAAQGAKEFGQNVGKGALAAGKEVVQNTKDMYNTGDEAAKSENFAKKAEQYVNALRDQLEKAQQQGLLTHKGDINSMSLGDIIDELQLATKGRQSFAGSAQRKGFTGGAGNAFRQGFQS